MFKHKSVIVKAIRVLALLTLLAFAYDVIRASLLLGETITVELAGSIWTLCSYLIAFALAILVFRYFLFYPGFVGIKTFSCVVIAIYGINIVWSIVSPYSIGDTITLNIGQLVSSLCIFSLGLVLAIWTIVYFKKMAEIYVKSDD